MKICWYVFRYIANGNTFPQRLIHFTRRFQINPLLESKCTRWWKTNNWNIQLSSHWCLWHKSGSTLAQKMACCLKAPSHRLIHFSSVGSVACSSDQFSEYKIMISICKMRLKITFLELPPHLPTTNELMILGSALFSKIYPTKYADGSDVHCITLALWLGLVYPCNTFTYRQTSNISVTYVGN